MRPPEKLFETLRELLAASNPGLVTRQDMQQLEDKLDELLALVDDIEARWPPPPTTSPGSD